MITYFLEYALVHSFKILAKRMGAYCKEDT